MPRRSTAQATTQSDSTSIEVLQSEIASLKKSMAALKKQVAVLTRDATPAEVIVLRTVPRDLAKQEIRELFQTGETLYFSDIARRLRIDLPLVVELCQELLGEGEVMVDDDAVRSR